VIRIGFDFLPFCVYGWKSVELHRYEIFFDYSIEDGKL